MLLRGGPQLCADACYAVTCPDGFNCIPEDGGECHPIGESCYGDGCPAGQICVDGECADDQCHGVECEDPQYCNPNGECVSPCVDVDCPPGQGCYEGTCVDDPCAGVICEPGLSCFGGACVQGDCFGVECEFYEICVDGECVHDPCRNLVCPDCLMCADGACYEYSPPQGMAEIGTHPGQPIDTDNETDSDLGGGDDTDGPEKGMTNVLATGAGGCLCCGVPGRSSGSLLVSLVELLKR